MIRLLALVLGDVEQIVSIYENSLFTTLSVYPYEIFGNFIKVIMFTIVPVVYIQYFPRLLLKDFCLPVFLAIILATIFFATLATIVFYKAMKKYESGNNIAMKE
jgi:ABC-2 type transport system permease protein